jgi:hypothetical protein
MIKPTFHFKAFNAQLRDKDFGNQGLNFVNHIDPFVLQIKYSRHNGGSMGGQIFIIGDS